MKNEAWPVWLERPSGGDCLETDLMALFELELDAEQFVIEIRNRIIKIETTGDQKLQAKWQADFNEEYCRLAMRNNRVYISVGPMRIR